jgi:hypothetical protein
MVTVGSQSSVIYGNNGVLTFNANVYAVAKTFNFKSGNKLEEEAVIGTDIPIINTAAYHGEFSMEIIWSSENTGANEQFSNLLVPVNGQIPAVSGSFLGKDVGNHLREFSWTLSMWPQQMEINSQGPSLMTAKLTGIYNARPLLG